MAPPDLRPDSSHGVRTVGRAEGLITSIAKWILEETREHRARSQASETGDDRERHGARRVGRHRAAKAQEKPCTGGHDECGTVEPDTSADQEARGGSASPRLAIHIVCSREMAPSPLRTTFASSSSVATVPARLLMVSNSWDAIA